MPRQAVVPAAGPHAQRSLQSPFVAEQPLEARRASSARGRRGAGWYTCTPCVEARTRPPGAATRRSSRTACAGSAQCSSTCVQRTRSKRAVLDRESPRPSREVGARVPARSTPTYSAAHGEQRVVRLDARSRRRGRGTRPRSACAPAPPRAASAASGARTRVRGRRRGLRRPLGPRRSACERSRGSAARGHEARRASQVRAASGIPATRPVRRPERRARASEPQAERRAARLPRVAARGRASATRRRPAASTSEREPRRRARGRRAACT